MGLENVGDSNFPVDKSMTVAELIDKYGEESIRRGLKYSMSLNKADEEFRDVDKKDMEEGYRKAYGEDSEPTEHANEWEKSINENGIGIEKGDNE
jgi:hypothetical protein